MIQESLMSETERVRVTDGHYAKITRVTYCGHSLFAVTAVTNKRCFLDTYYVSATATLIGRVYEAYSFQPLQANFAKPVNSCAIFCRSDAQSGQNVRFDLLADSVDEKHKMLVSWAKEILLEQLITYDI